MAHRTSNRRRNAWAVSLLDVRPEDRVLEIGFGPGIAIRELGRLARKGYVCGIDHSELMVRRAKRLNAEGLRRGVVDLRLGSVPEDLPAFDEPFDKILVVNATMFWREPVARLEELRRLLRSGGLIAVAHQPRGPGASDETSAAKGREIEAALAQAGFSEVRLETMALKPAVVCALGVNPGGRLTAEPGPRRGPGPLVRALGRAVNSAVARFPWSWRLFSSPVRRFFDSVAVGWDERVRSDSPEYLEPLVAALDRLEASPGRILDIGTGTGAAALELADRYPGAEVVGIDVSAEMVAQAKAKAADRSGPVRFLVADIASFEDKEGFDLIVMLNMPPFFDRVVALLRPEGFVVNASSFGSRTPFFTPPALLERGFERRGVRTVAVGQVGLGTYYLARWV